MSTTAMQKAPNTQPEKTTPIVASNKPAPNAQSLKAYFSQESVVKKFAEIGAKYFQPEEMIRLALLAASRQPDLLKCTQESILRALIDAAELGIKPGGTMGRGYLVPRRNKKAGTYECCFDPGWRGLSDIARRSGKIRRIESVVVFDADEFTVSRAPFTTVCHVPYEGKKRGAIRAAYGVAEFETPGDPLVEVVWAIDLARIRAVSAAEHGPWKGWEDEMSRKSAVRRLCKHLPYDPMLERAMALSDRADDNDFSRGLTVSPLQEKLAKKLSDRAVPAPNVLQGGDEPNLGDHDAIDMAPDDAPGDEPVHEPTPEELEAAAAEEHFAKEEKRSVEKTPAAKSGREPGED